MCNYRLSIKIEGYLIIPDRTENSGKIITLASKVSYLLHQMLREDDFSMTEQKISQKRN